MKNSNKQLVNGLIILVGSFSIVYTLLIEDASVVFKIAGVVFIMLGAYRASQHWVAHRDDHLNGKD